MQAGKTVLRQITSHHAGVDIVILAACGERAGEVVEILREFPELVDPKTGKSLMERTVIIGNTSSMPVAAREASLYTAVTMAEYYRQMGLHVLLLADSTSRWAQALREMSGRLEEIPGEEAFPAYLESTIAGFYERAGLVRFKDGTMGVGDHRRYGEPRRRQLRRTGDASDAQSGGSFHSLSRERSDARRYPAIPPLDSWSQYRGIIPEAKVGYALRLLARGSEVEQMMKVVGEEGTSLEDYIVYLKGDFLDAAYLQQNACDQVDKAASPERQRHVFNVVLLVLGSNFDLEDKEGARVWFNRLRQKFIDYKYKDALEKKSMGFIMSAWDGKLFKYGESFEREMMDLSVNIPLESALDLGWDILSRCFASDETGLRSELIAEFWPRNGEP
jgi:V/A-type H+-transporting ATPase subunit A